MLLGSTPESPPTFLDMLLGSCSGVGCLSDNQRSIGTRTMTPVVQSSHSVFLNVHGSAQRFHVTNDSACDVTAMSHGASLPTL